MIEVRFEVPEGALASLHKDPGQFTEELRLAAAVLWYQQRQLSQGRAAEVAGISRAAFIDALGRYGVSPFQSTAAELIAEALGE